MRTPQPRTPRSSCGAPGVLANDTDIDGPSLSAAVVTPAANGTVVLNANGSFTYTPNANFNGVDSFTYRASDGTALSKIAHGDDHGLARQRSGGRQCRRGSDASRCPAAATLAGSRRRRRRRSPRCGAKVSGPGTVTFGNPNALVDHGDVLALRHLRALTDRQRRPVRQQRHRHGYGQSAPTAPSASTA